MSIPYVQPNPQDVVLARQTLGMPSVTPGPTDTQTNQTDQTNQNPLGATDKSGKPLPGYGQQAANYFGNLGNLAQLGLGAGLGLFGASQARKAAAQNQAAVAQAPCNTVLRHPVSSRQHLVLRKQQH